VAGETAGERNTLLAVLTGLYIAGLAVFCVLEHGTLFAWPQGIVTGNLLASAIWAPLAIIHLDKLARRHHAHQLALAHKHHRELMGTATEMSTPANAPSKIRLCSVCNTRCVGQWLE
jgi:hypothetical protein